MKATSALKTQNPKPKTRNSKPETQNLKPKMARVLTLHDVSVNEFKQRIKSWNLHSDTSSLLAPGNGV